MKKFLMAALAAVFLSSAPTVPAMAGPVQNEVLFLMDSSGSMFDSTFSKWQSSIDWVRNFVDETHRADGSNAYGIINFSGGISSQTVENVKNAGRLNLIYGLTPGMTDPLISSPDTVPGAQDKASLDGFIGAMGPADFRNGRTWTDAALQLAYETFALSGNSDTNKFIILLTDGQITTGQHPVIAENGLTTYESSTLQNIRADDIALSVVTIDPLQSDVDDYLVPLVSAPELLFAVDGFNDFSDFLPAAAVAMPGPPAFAFLILGLGAIAYRRRNERS